MGSAKKGGGWCLPRSVAARALVLVAVIALVQVTLVIGMVVSQRDGAHIINISGAQRMRTQRIAYLAVAAKTGVGERAWRDELEATADAMLRVRGELLKRRDVSPMVPDANGNTSTSNAVMRYAQAARALVGDPHDATAYAYIEAQRLPLLAIAEESVRARTVIIESRNTQLVFGVIAGLCALLLAIWLSFKRIVEPSERRTTDLLARLNESEAEMRSLFSKNPDSIAIYDRDGRLVRANHASGELFGAGSEHFRGQHFARHIAPSHVEGVTAEFARALAGESVTFDTLFVSGRDERIDVHATLFPNVVGDRTVGVIGVATDTRALRRIEAALQVQSERITELYQTFAFQNQSWERQVRETLAVAAQRLGYEWASAIEVLDGLPAAVAVVGDAGFEDGDVSAIVPELALRSKSASDVWTIDDLARASLHVESTLRTMRWGSLLGVQLIVENVACGVLVLGARGPHQIPLDAVDRDFMRLVAALVGASIQRGRQERKLDALAFFDSLTSLPNRVMLEQRMAQILAASKRRDEQFAVHYLDLDRFKSINDRFGHAIGDEVLRLTARRLEACTRKEDTIARIGGDEFVIVQLLDADGRGAEELASRITMLLGKPFEIDGNQHHIGVSIGISIYPQGGTDQTTLLRNADEALLRAKVAGRNRVEFATPAAVDFVLR